MGVRGLGSRVEVLGMPGFRIQDLVYEHNAMEFGVNCLILNNSRRASRRHVMAAFGTRVRKLNEPTRGETGS